MKSQDFELYQDVLFRECGMKIDHDKAYLLKSRLAIVAKKAGCDDVDELTALLRDNESNACRQLAEVMVLKDTAFFRNPLMFDQLQRVAMPHIAAHKTNKDPINIWCVGASTGQEPYSIAMALTELEGDTPSFDYPINITASDISDHALMRAKLGEYSQSDVQCGIPARMLIKYFDQDGAKWRIRSDIQSLMTFTQSNLMDEAYPFDQFDIIICHDVLESFDEGVAQNVLERLGRHVGDNGLIYVGPSFLPHGQALQPLDDSHFYKIIT